jgi:hypothetical protein
MAAVKAEYPAFETIVGDKVKKKAESHLRFLKDIVKARNEYYPRYSAATESWKAFNFKNGTAKPKDFAAKLSSLKGCVDALALIESDWEAMRPRVQQMFQLCDSVATLDDTQKGAVETLLNDLKQ